MRRLGRTVKVAEMEVALVRATSIFATLKLRASLLIDTGGREYKL